MIIESATAIFVNKYSLKNLDTQEQNQMVLILRRITVSEFIFKRARKASATIGQKKIKDFGEPNDDAL